MASYKFEIYKDSAEQYRWRFKAPNGEIVGSSQGYTTKQSAKDGAGVVKNHAAGAVIEEVSS